MRFGLAGGAIAVIVLIVAILGYSTLFTVSQTQQALVVRLGKPVSVITEPGLNWKVPFIDSVIYVDKRILNIESPAQEVIASSKDNTNSGIGTEQAGERLVVDAFARYRIIDPLKYYQTVGVSGADAQLAILLNSALRRVLGAATLTDVVRDKREELMAKMRDQIDRDARPYRHRGGRRAHPPRRSAGARTARRSISACRPSGSARPPNSAPRAARKARRSAPGPIAT